MKTINKSDKEFFQEFLIVLAFLVFFVVVLYGFMSKESVNFSKKEYKSSLKTQLKNNKI